MPLAARRPHRARRSRTASPTASSCTRSGPSSVVRQDRHAERRHHPRDQRPRHLQPRQGARGLHQARRAPRTCRCGSSAAARPSPSTTRFDERANHEAEISTWPASVARSSASLGWRTAAEPGLRGQEEPRRARPSARLRAAPPAAGRRGPRRDPAPPGAARGPAGAPARRRAAPPPRRCRRPAAGTELALPGEKELSTSAKQHPAQQEGRGQLQAGHRAQDLVSWIMRLHLQDLHRARQRPPVQGHHHRARSRSPRARPTACSSSSLSSDGPDRRSPRARSSRSSRPTARASASIAGHPAERRRRPTDEQYVTPHAAARTTSRVDEIIQRAQPAQGPTDGDITAYSADQHADHHRPRRRTSAAWRRSSRAARRAHGRREASRSSAARTSTPARWRSKLQRDLRRRQGGRGRDPAARHAGAGRRRRRRRAPGAPTGRTRAGAGAPTTRRDADQPDHRPTSAPTR